MTRHEAGFTLIEVLVTLALSALVSVVLLHGIQLAAFGFARHTHAAERLDERQSLDDILRRTLAAAAAIPRAAGGGFDGRPDEIAFLAVAEDGGAGLYRIDLAIDQAQRDRKLVLRRRLAAPAGDPRAAASTIATRVRDFRLAYFGADTTGAAPGWHDDWRQRGTLPLMVRVILNTEGDPPRPPLIVRLWSAGL